MLIQFNNSINAAKLDNYEILRRKIVVIQLNSVQVCQCSQIVTFIFTFTFSHLADAFIQSDLQLGVHKAINLEEANIQRKCL